MLIFYEHVDDYVIPYVDAAINEVLKIYRPTHVPLSECVNS